MAWDAWQYARVAEAVRVPVPLRPLDLSYCRCVPCVMVCSCSEFQVVLNASGAARSRAQNGGGAVRLCQCDRMESW